MKKPRRLFRSRRSQAEAGADSDPASLPEELERRPGELQCVSDSEARRLIVWAAACAGGNIAEDDLEAIGRWAHFHRMMARIVDLAVAGKVELYVEDGEVSYRTADDRVAAEVAPRLEAVAAPLPDDNPAAGPEEVLEHLRRMSRRRREAGDARRPGAR
jgi:hypothetical protein